MENKILSKLDGSDILNTMIGVLLGTIVAGVIVNSLVPRVSTKLASYMSKPVAAEPVEEV